MRLHSALIFTIAALLVSTGALAIVGHSDLGPRFAVVSVGCFAAIAMAAFSMLPRHGFARFGPANLVTTARAAITALVGGLAAEADVLRDADTMAWMAALGVLTALALDGIDGALARRSGLASPYGASFDMEVDALLILFLSVLAFQLGKADAFVLAIGGLRYVFWAVGKFWPVLNADLGYSVRRQAICALQVATLCVLLMPVSAQPLSNGLAALALAALVFSFGKDVVDLLRGPAARAA